MGILPGSGSTPAATCTTVPPSAISTFSGNSNGIQTPLPLPQTFKPNQQQQNTMLMSPPPQMNVQVQ